MMSCGKILNVALIVALAGLLIAHMTLQTDLTQRHWLFLPDMAASKAHESFGASTDLPLGMTLQPPVPGTVARGQLPLHYAATTEDALRAAKELATPLTAPTDKDRTRGATVYFTFCQPCHGAQGKGDGPVTKRGFPAMSPLQGNARQMKDGQLFHIITYGQGTMPSYAPQISRLDRWRAILHVRSLQEETQK